MTDFLPIFQEIQREIQDLTKRLILISKTQGQLLSEEWITKDKAMKILGISASTLDRLCRSGELPFSKIHGMKYIKAADIEKILNKNYKNNHLNNLL